MKLISNRPKRENLWVHWAHKKYSEVIGIYIGQTSYLESIMDECIACFFVPFSQRKKILIHVLYKMTFRTKYDLFNTLLNEYYGSLLHLYKKEIEGLGKLYKRRNSLSHSFLMIPDKDIQRNNRKKITYFNMTASMTNGVQLPLNEFEDDKKKIADVTVALKKMRDILKAAGKTFYVANQEEQ